MKVPLRTKDLRDKLSDAIDAVLAGRITPADACAVAKLAAQINGSLIAEIEALRSGLFAQTVASKLGDLELGSDGLAPGARIIDRRPSAPSLGDPAPGRSALDQRNGARTAAPHQA